jgi:predicted small metal-binding protein
MARPKLPEIDKLKKRVRKRYPGSYCVQDSLGEYYITWNETNLNETFLLDNTSTEIKAWEQASITAKHEQHINRTHPLKALMSQEQKNLNKERITKRIRKL